MLNKCYLDANVLICFKNEDSQLFEKAIDLLQYLVDTGYMLYISPLVIDEFLYPMKFVLERKKEKDTISLLKKSLEDILKLPRLKIVNPPEDLSSQLKVISLMKKFKLQPRDAYHLIIMLSHKIEYFATFDKDFEIVFEKGIVKRPKFL